MDKEALSRAYEKVEEKIAYGLFRHCVKLYLNAEAQVKREENCPRHVFIVGETKYDTHTERSKPTCMHCGFTNEEGINVEQS